MERCTIAIVRAETGAQEFSVGEAGGLSDHGEADRSACSVVDYDSASANNTMQSDGLFRKRSSNMQHPILTC